MSKLECKPVMDDKTSSQSAGAVEEHWTACVLFWEGSSFFRCGFINGNSATHPIYLARRKKKSTIVVAVWSGKTIV